MIKELLLAILLGALLGFGITGGYYAYKNSQTKKPIINQQSPTPDISQSPSPVTQEINSTTNELTIISPDNEAVINTPVVTLKGTTSANSLIVVQSTIKSYTTQADDNGNFSLANVELEGGINLLQISSFDSNDSQSEVELYVTYSSAKI